MRVCILHYYWLLLVLFTSKFFSIFQTNGFISNFAGLVNGTQARAKFKSLKDFFRKIVTAEKLPSGSASKSTSDWKFYKMMNFTRNFFLNEP